MPATSNGSPCPGRRPPSGVVIAAPNVYSIGSPCESPEPDSGRQRARIAGSARHCLFSNGSYSCVPSAGRVLLPGRLAGVEHAPALVDEVAHLEQLLHRQPRRVARAPARLAGHDVVARVPDDRVVVAEHAEVVGRRAAVGVDVVDVEGDAVRAQRVRVVREVLRRGRPGWAGDAPV